MKRCSTSYLVREMQIKNIYIITQLLECPKSGILTILNAGKDVEHQELSFIADGNKKWHNHFGKEFVFFCLFLFMFLSLLCKIKHPLSIGCSNCTPWYLPEKVEIYVYAKNLHIDRCFQHLYSSLLKLGSIQYAFSR